MPQSGRAKRSDAGQARTQFHNKVFRNFSGINTQAQRQAIGPEEFAWIENVMPIGRGNAVVVPAPGQSLCSVPSGIVYFMKAFNRNGLNYMLMVTTTGHAYECGLESPFPFAEITNPAAPQLSGGEIGMDQWENTLIVITDATNGFFTWNGTTLVGPTSIVSITILSGGTYTAVPTISFSGGGGSGAAATANLGLNGTQTITVAGTGYVVGDILTLVGGTFTTPGSVKVTTIGGGGAVTAVAVFDPGSYSVLPAAAVATTGSVGGTGCTITPSYAVFSATVTNIGTGYTSAPAVAFSAGAAAATANLIGAPTGADRVASFSGRVWVAANRVLAWTAPNTYNDFIGPGSGSLIFTDSTLNSAIAWLESANNFMYVGGVNSVNIIGDVQVDANGNTIFSNTNLSASVGTRADFTVIPYYRQLLFQNNDGVYSIAGASPTKISDALDGIFRDTDFHGIISAGQFSLLNILCAAFLVLYNASGAPSTADNSRPLLLIYFNKKWMVANQDAVGRLTVIAGGVANEVATQRSVLNLYGTDGTSLFQLFSDPSTPVDWEIQTAFWDMADDALPRNKELNAFGFEGDFFVSGTVAVSLDTLNNSVPYADTEEYDVPFDVSTGWVNNSNSLVQWINNASAVVAWGNVGYVMVLQNGEGFGKYVGMTLTSSDTIGTLTSMALRYIFRDEWTDNSADGTTS